MNPGSDMRLIRFVHCLLLGLALVGIPAFGGSANDTLADALQTLRQKFPDVPVITTEELAAIPEADRPFLLDVRDEKEFVVSHLPGAHRAETNVTGQLTRLGISREDSIVLYCSVGYRSAHMARKLRKAGYENVRNLEGSIFAWANEGRPLVDATGPARGVHPYDRKWGQFLDGHLWQWTPSTNVPAP